MAHSSSLCISPSEVVLDSRNTLDIQQLATKILDYGPVENGAVNWARRTGCALEVDPQALVV